MKKLALIIIGLLIFTGCDLFAIPPDMPEDKVVEVDPVVVEDPVVVIDPVVVEKPPVVVVDPVIVEQPLVVVEPVVVEANPDDSPEVLLAKCLTEKGYKLYTAEWCGHCKKQKAAFKDGLEYLNWTECAEGEDWAQECEDAGIAAVPSWILPDESKMTGNTPLETLANLSECMYDI